MEFQADVIVIGAGLAGLVATHEAAKAGKRVLVVDQENRNNLGGQAFWSLGGLFFVDSAEQRRTGIKDSLDLALQDWFGSAQFDRLQDEDYYGARWAKAYVHWAAEGKREYLSELGLRSMPFVSWAERGDGSATGHGNSVPRFHITWGTGPGVVEVFEKPVLEAERAGLVQFAFRHQITALIVEAGAVVGVGGNVLAPDNSQRGVASNRDVVGQFEYRASAVVVASGGIGHNHDLMRQNWPTSRLGSAPQHMISGVPASVDGSMLGISEQAGAMIVNRDRMWAYTEGVHNWDPIWPDHAIRILPGPSSMWFDATGQRLKGSSGVPGADSLGAMRQILSTGYDYSWFITTQTILEKEFSLSGSEQNPDMTGKNVKEFLRSRIGSGAPEPVANFQKYGADFVVADTVEDLVTTMNELAEGRGPALDAAEIRAQIVARDRQLNNPFGKDVQVMTIHNARRGWNDNITRVAAPHEILDPAHGPLTAVRLNILSRKTLGGLQTNLDSQVIGAEGQPIPGLFAAGEVAGFGGGGVHGYNALEGTFLGGCIFSGKQAGEAIGKL